MNFFERHSTNRFVLVITVLLVHVLDVFPKPAHCPGMWNGLIAEEPLNPPAQSIVVLLPLLQKAFSCHGPRNISHGTFVPAHQRQVLCVSTGIDLSPATMKHVVIVMGEIALVSSE